MTGQGYRKVEYKKYSAYGKTDNNYELICNFSEDAMPESIHFTNLERKWDSVIVHGWAENITQPVNATFKGEK